MPFLHENLKTTQFFRKNSAGSGRFAPLDTAEFFRASFGMGHAIPQKIFSFFSFFSLFFSFFFSFLPFFLLFLPFLVLFSLLYLFPRSISLKIFRLLERNFEFQPGNTTASAASENFWVLQRKISTFFVYSSILCGLSV